MLYTYCLHFHLFPWWFRLLCNLEEFGVQSVIARSLCGSEDFSLERLVVAFGDGGSGAFGHVVGGALGVCCMSF